MMHYLCGLPAVLIESDWNLKHHQSCKGMVIACVLIESDWNLKFTYKKGKSRKYDSINRIRLEFKEEDSENQIERYKAY